MESKEVLKLLWKNKGKYGIMKLTYERIQPWKDVYP